MAVWDAPDMAAVLAPENEVAVTDSSSSSVATSNAPQAHGWAERTALDYNLYNTQDAAAFDDAAARNASRTWAGNATRYEFKEEYGEIGPPMPLLEAELFGNGGQTAPSGLQASIMNITVAQEGPIQVDRVAKFEDAGLHPAMMDNVRLCNYTVPTPIQQYAMSVVREGYDLLASAQTGSGKTAAFLIPVLNKFMGKAKKVCAPRPNPATWDLARDGPFRAEPLILVVCPTRELATQTFDQARKLCYRTMLRPAVVYGGTDMISSIQELSRGADILIATPGRLIDLLSRRDVLTLRRLRYTVIDEADEMLHSDWETEFKEIMTGGNQEPDQVTRLMFSATFPKSVRDLAQEYLKDDHVRIRVGRVGSTHANIVQDIVFVEQHYKKKAVEDLLLSYPAARTIIFVNSKRAADEVDDHLYNAKFPCASMHGGRTQREREDVMRAFRAGTTPILITTGVTARGIDVAFIGHVINYELPKVQHGGIEEYIHRIGRTGRRGATGRATSFYNESDADLGPALTMTLCETNQSVPEFLLEFLPEGFTADGQGDVSKLRFDADENADAGHESGSSEWSAGSGITEESKNADQSVNAPGPAALGGDASTIAPAASAPALDIFSTDLLIKSESASSVVSAPWEAQQNVLSTPALEPQPKSPTRAVRFVEEPTAIPTTPAKSTSSTATVTPGAPSTAIKTVGSAPPRSETATTTPTRTRAFAISNGSVVGSTSQSAPAFNLAAPVPVNPAAIDAPPPWVAGNNNPWDVTGGDQYKW